MIAPIASTSTPPTTGTSQTSSSSSPAVTQNMFLQLLVAQLQNQDPTQPMDSTTFVTQLAQLQQLDQSVSTGQDVSSILTDLNTMVGSQSATQSATTPQS